MVDVIFDRSRHGTLVLQYKVQYNPQVPSAVSLYFKQVVCGYVCMRWVKVYFLGIYTVVAHYTQCPPLEKMYLLNLKWIDTG